MTTRFAFADDLLSQLNAGTITSTELTQSCLSLIKKHDGQTNAFLLSDGQAALEQAAAIDEDRNAGRPVGQLAGIPVALKDVLCTQGTLTTCGSRMLENYVPPYDATVVRRLREAGCVFIGKTNMDEFAMGSSNENSAFGPARNPWNLDCSPGGSSGGSAVAVAAGYTPLSVGSDTGGSIRQPASFCGVVGMKPTYGRVSRYGLVAYASSLDQIGPFAGDVRGAARLLQVLAGHDPADSTSVDRPVPDYLADIDQPLSSLTIGNVPEYYIEGLDEEVREATERAVDVFRSLGATIRNVSLPHAKYAVATYYVIGPAEASSNLARYDGIHYGHRADQFENMIDLYSTSRGEAFGAEVKRRILIGTYTLSAGYYDAYYLKALKVRRLIRQDFDAAFNEVDLIIGPVAPTPAFKIGELVDDPLAMYLSDYYTIPVNLAGLPGISIPAGQSSSGLPIGLQLIGPAFEEARVLRAARMFEAATDWHMQKPALGQ